MCAFVCLCVYLNVILATSIPEDDSSSNCNGNGAHGMPGLAPKGGSMSRLPSCELLGLRTHGVVAMLVKVSECDYGIKHT